MPFHETHARSVAKALSWRLLGTIATSGLVFAFTRRVSLSLAVGGLEFVAKIGLFWLHERAWERTRFGRRALEPAVVWFTGLSGSGKSAVADQVAAGLRAWGLRVERLDGDVIREILPGTGFTREERDAHIRRVGFLASRLERHGVCVLVSLVSPYEASRRFVRDLCGRFVEVHVATPLAECERRDVKGLYARARRGELPHFTGVDDPYEPPSNPEIVLDTTGLSAAEAGQRVLAALHQRGVGVT